MAVAYGSITIVDIGDLGQLSVIPESNQPNTVIYDPNVAEASQYNPNWEKNNLVLTPVIYYGATELKATDSGVTVAWKRKAGSNDPIDIDADNGETVKDGILTVKKNILASESQITYICKVSYQDSATMGAASLKAQGRISFSAIKNASNVKSASITGESVFLYNTNGELVSSGSITLTATLNALDIKGWSYKDNTGKWTEIKDSEGNSITSINLTVKDSDNYFVNDIATIQVNTKDPVTENSSAVTDIHVITKIRDGAPGDQIVSAVLSNDNQMIPCNSSGNPLEGSLKDVNTKITIYEGSRDITQSYDIDVTSVGVTGSYDNGAYTYKVESLTAMVGTVTFTCTPKEESEYNSPVVKKFTLTKIQPGADGTSPTIYSLESSSLVINKNIVGNWSPSSITLKAYSQTGNNDKKAYAGRFQVINDEGKELAKSTSDESEHIYEINSSTTNTFTVKLYEAGTTETLLDSQTIIIVSDGATGATGSQGTAGKDAISFVLGNYSDIIPCTNTGAVASTYETTIPYSAYQGTTKLNSVSASVSGLIANEITADTTTSGVITLTFQADVLLGNKDEGAITITLSAEGASNTQTYTWAKNKQAADGQNAMLFQVYAPEGNVIVNGENSVTLATKLVNGATEITENVGYSWYKWNGSEYLNIEGKTGSSLIVTATDVSSYGSYKCVATYGTDSYEAYLSVYDKTDPIQLQVISSLGDKLVNSVGQGIVYVRAYQNGEEIDKMLTTSCGTSYPTAPSDGAYFYLLNKQQGTATLYKYSSGTWVAEGSSNADGKTYSYGWTLTQSDGTTSTASGKAIYLDADVVNKKTIFDVKLTIKTTG